MDLHDIYTILRQHQVTWTERQAPGGLLWDLYYPADESGRRPMDSGLTREHLEQTAAVLQRYFRA